VRLTGGILPLKTDDSAPEHYLYNQPCSRVPTRHHPAENMRGLRKPFAVREKKHSPSKRTRSMSNDYQRIKQQYDHLQGDSTGLFSELIRASKETGMDEVLAYLEGCVIEKRLAWLKTNFGDVEKGKGSLEDGYRWFFEKYLKHLTENI